MDERPLIREREAADMLNVSVAALRKWRREGKGPRYIKVGRLVRYRVAELDSFVTQHEHTPTSVVGRLGNKSRTQEGGK